MSKSIAVIAHRGASGLTGEDNTLRSFALAIDLRCDYVEFDVRRSRDEVVCFHDARVGPAPVAQLTLGELRERTGLAVPTLGEVLDFCRGRIGLDVEIKDPGVEAEVLAARCQQHLDERLKLMWYSLSNFQMHAGGADSGVQYATGWRYAPGVYGQTWFIGSGWQARSEALYRLAGEVAAKAGSTPKMK